MPSVLLSPSSIAPDARDWLAHSCCPRILHVFDHVCNLLNERREVLSIVTPQIGNGPFNLVVEADILFSNHLNIESTISIHVDRLNLGDLTIHTTDAELWSPRPDWERLHAKRNDILTQLSSSVPNYQPLLPISLISNLSCELAKADISSTITLTSKLAGLGAGLTPAGDDFLLGAIYTAWIIHPLKIARALAKEMANTAAPLTTSLSAAWLRSAGRGEAGVLWHEFLDTLISANPMRLHEAIDKILAVGETSGADALTGFFGTFISWGELSNSKTS